MMPNFKKIILLLAALSFFGNFAKAQQLAELSPDPAIKTGVLPNGLRYCLATNTVIKGRADYALVRKGCFCVPASRKAVEGLPSFPGINPCQFLADKGVGYTPDGCISYRDAGSIIHFRNVPVFDEATADSTLLILFDLVRTVDCPQTIIVSGDINRDLLTDRMHMLSMTVPKLPSASGTVKTREWKANSNLTYDILPLGHDGLAEINMVVEAPRTPDNMMNTAVPFVTGRFAALLKNVLEDRIIKNFKEKGIPFGKMNLVHYDSSVKTGNEKYSLSLITDEKYASEATAVLSGIVDELICKGADPAEFSAASMQLSSEAASRETNISNSEYVEKCICFELYGASLAPASETDKYFASSMLPPQKELPLFNNFVYALLDPEKTKHKTTDSTDVQSPAEDIAEFEENTGKSKLRLTSTTTEPITGGELWSFSNGMKVIFKKEDSPGRFEYGLMIKGGAPVAPEILNCFDVAGMNGTDFSEKLQHLGITMKCSISESDLRLQGAAPTERLQFLLNVLANLSKNRKFSLSDYYYRTSCWSIERKADGFNAGEMLEDMMSPGYEYSSSQLADSLNGRMPLKAEKYFFSQFSRMNDGVFVIIGDFDSSTLQKTLSRSLYSFNCGKSTSIRPRIRHDIRQGWYTRMRTGEKCVAMSITVSYPFSLDGYMSFKLASTALRREIVKELASKGMYAEFSEDVEFFPSETYTVKVVCRPCSIQGLPASIIRQNAMDVLNSLRRAVNGLSSASISEGTLKACKAELESEITSMASSPSLLVDAAMTRYSVGRDVLSNWKTSLGKVSSKDVSSVLRKMENGARMEIVSR